MTGHRVSKRAQLISLTWLWAVGYIITIVFPAYWPLVCGRSLKGFTIGYLSGLMPSYINECFNDSDSTTVLALYQAFWPLGIAMMALVGYLGCVASFGRFGVSQCWMLMLSVTMPAPLLSFFLRNSPTDFVGRGFNSQAYDVLNDIYRRESTTILASTMCENNSSNNNTNTGNAANNSENNNPVDSESLNNRFMSLYTECHAVRSQGIWRDIERLLKDKFNRKRLFVAVFCQASVQLSGINLISI